MKAKRLLQYYIWIIMILGFSYSCGSDKPVFKRGGNEQITGDLNPGVLDTDDLFREWSGTKDVFRSHVLSPRT